jgi:O-antigen/teichoic acid export membrane protein
MNLLRLLNYFRLRPFDPNSEQGRADERHRKIALTAASAALSKLVSLGTSIISIPLTMHYLGPERFGLWMTINSIVVVLSFADFGIGNGLLNAIAEANGKDDHDAMRRYISSAYVVLGAISVLIILVFQMVYPFLLWEKLFTLKNPVAIEEVGTAVEVFVIIFALNISASIIQRVQLGLQLGFQSNLWQIAAGLLTLIAIILFIQLQLGLPWLVGALVGVPLLVAILNGLVFFLFSRKDLKPRFLLVTPAATRKIVKTGLLFFMLQITASVAFASDNIIIAKMLGAEAVGHYAVPEKLFSMIPMALGMVLMPLWPAYGEAIGRGDGAWVQKILKKSMILAFGFSTLSAIAIVLSAGYLLELWVGATFNPSLALLIGFGVWKICEACGNSISMLLNGGNVVGFQLKLAGLLLVVSVPMKLLMLGEFGLPGVIWATVLSYSLCVLIPLLFSLPKILSKYKNI